METNDKKQAFLITEIIDKGYEPSAFEKFLDSIKANQGDNIDAWSMNELQEAVDLFQKQFKKPETIEIDLNDQQPASPLQSNDSDLTQSPKSSSDFVKTMNCKQIQTTIVGQMENVEVKIQGFDKVGGGIFSSGYYVFNILSEPFNWKVQRRYSDFIQLREIIVRQNPGLSLPFIPEEKSQGRLNDYKLSKQASFLQRFLQKILKKFEFKNDNFFVDFLSLTNEKDLKNSIKNYLKGEKAKKIEQVSTPDGNIQIRVSEELNKYFDRSDSFLENTLGLQKKVRLLQKQLLTDYSQVSKRMFDISTTYQGMYIQCKNLNQTENDIEKCDVLEDMYLILYHMFEQWGHIIQDQIKIIDENLNRFQKFQNFEFRQLKDVCTLSTHNSKLIKYRDISEQEYGEYFQKLQQKKEKLFVQGDMFRWEMPLEIYSKFKKEEIMQNKKIAFQNMLPKENFQLRELKYVYGFYNLRTYEELKRVLKESGIEMNYDFKQFAKKQLLSLSQMHELWADTLSNVDNLKDEPTLIQQ